MNKNQALMFSFINLLSLVAAIAGTLFLLFGTDLQIIGGWSLLIGAEFISWLTLERGVKITRYFSLTSSFIILIMISFVVISDWLIIFLRYDLLLLLVYLLFRTFYLTIPPGEVTFLILMSSVLTVFTGILLIMIDSSEIIWFIVIAIFISGELLYFWKRNNKLPYHRTFGMISFTIIFFLLLIVFAPLQDTLEFRLDLFLILLYTPFRFFESTLPKSSTNGRTVAFQLSYSLLGFGLIIFAILLEVMLALETLGPTIPSYNDVTWSWLEYLTSLLKTTLFLEFGGFLKGTFQLLEISVLFLGGLSIIIISEFVFISNLVVSSFSNRRKFTKDSIYFKLQAILWYVGILVAIFGYYIAEFILKENSSYLDASNWLKLLISILAAYLVIKLFMNCAITTIWGPITTTLISQLSLITSILITYFFTETIHIENLPFEPFVLGISFGIIGVLFLLIATYTIRKRLKSYLLYFWVGWSAIELIMAIIGLLQNNYEIIIVTVPVFILCLIVTVVSSKGKWWMTGAEKKEEFLPPPAPRPPSLLETELEELKSSKSSPLASPPIREGDSTISDEQKVKKELEKKMREALNEL